MLTIASPLVEKEEIKAVNDVLNSGMLAQGPKVAELEKLWADYCGTKFSLAVNSGTAAIHASLFAAGVEEGDEVITTPYSFIATINPIMMLGAKPVLVDIEPRSFNIDTNKIERAITPKTKAIIPVHLYGQPCDMDELNSIAKKHNLAIIEDACQAIGATYKNKKAGNLGDLGCFSLYATKNIMCGEGGMITTNSQEQADAIRRFRQHGMNSQYQYEHIGYNYRMSDLHAAIAIEQLKKVDKLNDARQKNAEKLSKGLEAIKGIELPEILKDRTHVFHQFTVRVSEDLGMSRDKFVEKLREKEIGAGVYYPKPLHHFGHIASYGFKKGDFPVAEQIAEEVVSLPIHPKITSKDVDYMIKTIKEIVSATA